MRNIEIGKRIKERRTEMEISIMELASATGLSKATLHRYENGDIKNIKIPVVRDIAKCLKVNPAWLVGKSEIKERPSNGEPIEIEEVLTRLLKLIEDDELKYKDRPVDPFIVKTMQGMMELVLELLKAKK